jgi:iron complex outermembrane receptor protein
MIKPSLLALCISTSLVSLPSFANSQVSGTVTDDTGAPIVGAEIKLEGSKKVIYTDAQGRYLLTGIDQSKVHLHVFSANHIHGDKDLGTVLDSTVVDFVLPKAGIENILVTATALQTSVLESVTPISVLGSEELHKRQAPTLGETLKNTAGVHSTYYGPVASSPVIRGNDGPRVKIVQNGLDVSDVSRIGPDHNVAANTSSATQVEILRGPATLQYGSGAIGGVVNVVDNRIPRTLVAGVEGEVEASYSTADNGRFGRVDVTGSQGQVGFHFDGFKRKTDDVDIPGYASVDPDEDEVKGTLESSEMDTTNFTAGLSYIGDDGYIGFAVESLDNLYGVPGHSHDHEEEDHDDEDHDEEEHDEAEEGTKLDVDMTRYQLAGEWFSPFKGFTAVKLAAAYTDYQHVEIEDGEVGTLFSNKGSDVRISAHHKDISDWHGVIGLQVHDADYKAVGEEAFTPATNTQSYALYVVEQKKVGDILFELGGRIEQTEYDPSDMTFELHTDAHEHEEEEGEEDDAHSFSFENYDFTSTSFSAGINWEFTQGQALAVTLSRNERAPSQQELFSAGEHLATETFEVGLVYDMDEDGEISDQLLDPKKEVSTNIDITLRKFIGDWGYTISAFYNQADDYIYQSGTGLIAITEEHEEEEEEDHEDEGVDVYYFKQQDADIYGLELEGFYDVSQHWRVNVFADVIHAKLANEDLPRIPPMRIGATLSYELDGLSAEVSTVHYNSQTRVASYETQTDGYTLLNANVQYEMPSEMLDWVFYAKADNLTNEEARVHTSFLKDKAPLPGRNITLGVRAQF